MTSVTDNLPMGGTEPAYASDADTSQTWDYYDPDEDQDTVAAPAEGEIESGEETEQTEAAPPEEAGHPDEAAETEAAAEGSTLKDDVKVTLAEGVEVPLAELKNGYLRQSDYTRKTTEVAERRKAVDAQADRINRTIEAFAETLASRIPPAPDVTLSVTDPGRFVREKAAHEAAVAQVTQILELGQQAKSVKDEMSAADRDAMLRAENEALIRTFPETANPDGRKAFFGAAVETAKSLGYSDEEIRQAHDHRIFGLAYWASKGMAAEKAKEQAKAKVANAPPVTAAPKRPQVQQQVTKNREAMQRLRKSGSIHDAVNVDWD